MAECIKKEYIEKSEVIKKLCTETAEWYLSPTIKLLKEIPAADVQPIKRGHWYDNTYKYVEELDAYFIQARCSCCNRYSDRIDQYIRTMSNECCSHCGADMRGDSK